MLLALTLLTGCSNVYGPPWSGGGTRLASGIAAITDTADTAGSGDTGGTEAEAGGPDLTTGTALYVTDEAEHTYITAAVAFEDAEGDVTGGRIYFTVLANGESVGDGDRTLTEDASADPTTEAIVADGTITFTTDAVETGYTNTLDPVFVRDGSNHRSNEIEIDVTGE